MQIKSSDPRSGDFSLSWQRVSRFCDLCDLQSQIGLRKGDRNVDLERSSLRSPTTSFPVITFLVVDLVGVLDREVRDRPLEEVSAPRAPKTGAFVCELGKH